MKDQYVGDINDYRKYALLRALSAGGANRIGVCWMLTPSDASANGGKLAYLSQPTKYRQHDPELFDLLALASAEQGWRRLRTIEASDVLLGSAYFNATLTDNRAERAAFISGCAAAFIDVDLVFFDPDNGLDVPSIPNGRKKSSKYLYLDEVSAFHDRGQSVLIYQHFIRKNRTVFTAECVERLRSIAPAATIYVFRTPHVVFLLVLHERASKHLVDAAHRALGRWNTRFIEGSVVHHGLVPRQMTTGGKPRLPGSPSAATAISGGC